MKVIAMQIVRHIIMHEYYFVASFSRIIYVNYLSCLFLHNSLIIISTICFSITIVIWTALSEVWYLKIRINMLEDPAYFIRSSVAQSCPSLCDPMNCSSQASLSITNSRSSLRLMSIESVMPSSHLILCRFLLLLPPIPPSIRIFSNESTLRMRWPKYWSFSFSIIPSKEIPGLISFRMDWLDLLTLRHS